MTYEEKLKQIKELFITNGIQPETFDSIVQCKSQFLKKPFKNISIETVQNYLTNFIALSDLLDTELDALAKRDFQIFYNNPEYIKEKTDVICQALNITQQEFYKMGKCCPSIFHLKTETIIQKVDMLAKVLEVSPKELISMLKRHPVLIIYKPKTLIQKVKKISQLLDITPEELKKLIKKNPVLIGY